MQKAYEFDFVYDTQAAFRLLLEALSNPGRIVELGPLPGNWVELMPCR